MGAESVGKMKFSVLDLVLTMIRAVRSGNRSMKRLALLISLNVAYLTAELAIGLFTGRVGEDFYGAFFFCPELLLNSSGFYNYSYNHR